MAGMMALSRELAVFIAPFINSYKRYASLSWAPVNVVWGRDNRTTGFRLVGHGPGLHVEDRFPGGDMNAYLTYAAMVGAGLYGIRHGLKLEPEFKGNGYLATGHPRMPRALYEAIGELERSEAARRDLRPGRGRPLPQRRARRAGDVRLGRPSLGPRALPRTGLTAHGRAADSTGVDRGYPRGIERVASLNDAPSRGSCGPSLPQRASAARHGRPGAGESGDDALDRDGARRAPGPHRRAGGS